MYSPTLYLHVNVYIKNKKNDSVLESKENTVDQPGENNWFSYMSMKLD